MPIEKNGTCGRRTSVTASSTPCKCRSRLTASQARSTSDCGSSMEAKLTISRTDCGFAIFREADCELANDSGSMSIYFEYLAYGAIGIPCASPHSNGGAGMDRLPKVYALCCF